MKVKDAMSKDPVTIDPEAPLRAAADLMRAKGIRHLPVVDGAGSLVGILTDRDLRHAAFVPALAEHLMWERRRLQALRVRDAMTWSVVTTHPEAALARAGLMMFERRIGSLPVVEDGRLVGVVTERDLVRVLQKERPGKIDPEWFLW
jgi:CBS domain-containing protein